jgi:hypothetical protein
MVNIMKGLIMSSVLEFQDVRTETSTGKKYYTGGV